ncbi:MAG TPA: 3-phosphoserine/phosphohydroxythreonine transaminase [Pseudomonadales bacterium]
MNRLASRNFSGGPGALPDEVLIQTRDAIARAPGTNQSILGISHRSDWFRAMLQESEDNLRALLGIPDGYHVLQLQGGSSLQFSMIPILLLRGRNAAAEYLRTGYWSSKSIPDAQREGHVRILYDGAPDGFRRLPAHGELAHDPDAAYFHYVSNETVEGSQFHYLPGLSGVPRVCDMSSDFLSRPFAIEDFSLVYAHAQKNLGPSGLTVVILKDELLRNAPDDVHSMLDYRNHVAMSSIYNTPPVFAIYVTMLVTRWLRERVGGLEQMAAINARKAEMLYALIDAHPEFFRLHVERPFRSQMNVALRLPTPELEARFLAEAEEAGFYGLDGHRTLGGLRASLYNAVVEEDVASLAQFMDDFRAKAMG